ncbi:hypothetical protein EJB05_37450, partial [Eragrostis curvula]
PRLARTTTAAASVEVSFASSCPALLASSGRPLRSRSLPALLKRCSPTECEIKFLVSTVVDVGDHNKPIDNRSCIVSVEFRQILSLIDGSIITNANREETKFVVNGKEKQNKLSWGWQLNCRNQNGWKHVWVDSSVGGKTGINHPNELLAATGNCGCRTTELM